MQTIDGFSLSRTSDTKQTSVEQVKDLVHKSIQSNHVSQGHLFPLAMAPVGKKPIEMKAPGTRMLRNCSLVCFFIYVAVPQWEETVREQFHK